MQLHSTERVALLAICTLVKLVQPQPAETLPATILGGIGSVASTATDFLSGVVQRQKELLHRVTDTAANYINNAVERPKNLLINATRATTGYIDNAASKGLEFKLRRFLEKLRSRMGRGIPELGIPPLEPLQLDEIDITIENPEIGNLTIIAENLALHQLSTFVVTKARLSLIGPTITVNVSVPEVYADGHYNMSGILGDTYPVYGAGPFQLIVRDFRIYINTMLGYSRGMYMKSFDLDYAIGSVALQLDNFMGGAEVGRIMTQVVQELAPQVMDIMKPEILPGIQNYIAAKANETIRHLTMRDIFIVLLGQNDIRDFADFLVP